MIHLLRAWLALTPIALALLLCGCHPMRLDPSLPYDFRDHLNARYESEGAPFHFPLTSSGRVDLNYPTLLGTPAPTAANDAQQADIIARIGGAESSIKGRSAEVKIREVRSWPGAGPGVREVWVLADPPPPKWPVAYVVTFTPSDAGTEIGVKGPFQ